MILAGCVDCNTLSLVREQPGVQYRVGQYVGTCPLMVVTRGNTEAKECDGDLAVISISV